MPQAASSEFDLNELHPFRREYQRGRRDQYRELSDEMNALRDQIVQQQDDIRTLQSQLEESRRELRNRQTRDRLMVAMSLVCVGIGIWGYFGRA